MQGLVVIRIGHNNTVGEGSWREGSEILREMDFGNGGSKLLEGRWVVPVKRLVIEIFPERSSFV